MWIYFKLSIDYIQNGMFTTITLFKAEVLHRVWLVLKAEYTINKRTQQFHNNDDKNDDDTDHNNDDDEDDDHADWWCWC